MGKNAGKPVRHTGGGGGGDSYEDAWEKREFHSKEYQQRELEMLLNAPERMSWDEWKALQQKKKAEEEAEFFGAGEDMLSYRRKLDAEREAKLQARAAAKEEARAESDKGKRAKKEKKRKGKDKEHKKGKSKKRRRESDGDSSSSSGSDKGKGKKGPIKLSAFFQNPGDDSDTL
mmetsp:Transcript_10470/g.35526  ORF Transcript_10470/g.35526 Transcript_10470/m.35526 type:complete len:174 (-) Transcript_10470:668-1189(-)